MQQARKRTFVVALVAVGAGSATAQIPDLLNALDAGGRAMGVSGSTGATDGNTLSTYNNPAGLAFLQAPAVNVTFRNLPESDTTLRRRFVDPELSTSNRVGASKMTHLGYATPFRGGVLGLSYTLGGYVRDSRFGDRLTFGEVTVNSFEELLQAQIDYFTVAYARRRGDTNVGVGLTVANQYVRNVGSYDIFGPGNALVGTTRFDNTGNRTGVGLIAGVQRVAADGSNVVGASLRTPISLSRNSRTGGYMDRIPGRASLGYAARSGFFQQGRDFLAYAAQLDYFFGGDGDGLLDRKDTLAGSVGVEYNLHRGPSRIPVRVGYAFVPKGGDAFKSRNSLGVGIGYRPDRAPYAIDVSFGFPSGAGGADTGLSITYRLK